MSSLPPLNALRAFEAAGRHKSITAAATELHVTAGAISKQLKTLEGILGLRLAVRSRSGLTLTPEGRALHTGLHVAFHDLGAAVQNLRLGKVAGSISVACMPAFATHWLIPRLEGFYARFPEVSLTIVPPDMSEPFRETGLDAAILFGQPAWQNVEIHLLKQIEFFPVCSPLLMSGVHRIQKTADLVRHCLLDDQGSTHWRDWFALMRTQLERTQRRLRFTDFNQNLAAARAGLGIAMGDNVTAVADLASGALVRPIEGALRPTSEAYYLLAPESVGMQPATNAFIDWIRREANRDDMPPGGPAKATRLEVGRAAG